MPGDTIFYEAIQQVSFELENLIGEEQAEKLRQELADLLYTSDGNPTGDQVSSALILIRSYPEIQKKIKSFVENTRTLGFSHLPGEIKILGCPPDNARLLVCPVDGDQKWDIPLNPGERRKCLKHRVFYKDAGPLGPYLNPGGKDAG
jgi:hypothetical protein